MGFVIETLTLLIDPGVARNNSSPGALEASPACVIETWFRDTGASPPPTANFVLVAPSMSTVVLLTVSGPDSSPMPTSLEPGAAVTVALATVSAVALAMIASPSVPAAITTPPPLTSRLPNIADSIPLAPPAFIIVTSTFLSDTSPPQATPLCVSPLGLSTLRFDTVIPVAGKTVLIVASLAFAGPTICVPPGPPPAPLIVRPLSSALWMRTVSSYAPAATSIRDVSGSASDFVTAAGIVLQAADDASQLFALLPLVPLT